MSNDKSRDALSDAAIPQKNHPVEVVKSGSPLDVVFWLIAIVLLIGATMVNQYLPQYVPAASDVWVRIAAVVACIVAALGLLYATQQGKGFIRLLKDSRLELRRVSWPTKQETLTTCWHVLAVVVIASIVLWCFDYFLDWAIKLIIG